MSSTTDRRATRRAVWFVLLAAMASGSAWLVLLSLSSRGFFRLLDQGSGVRPDRDDLGYEGQSAEPSDDPPMTTADVLKRWMNGGDTALSAREQTFVHDRMRAFEELGEIPEYANAFDIELLRRTSWFGRCLEADKFWEGRAVWMDATALRDANRAGRRFPPIPHEDERVGIYSDEDLEGPSNVRGLRWHRYSDRERAFWELHRREVPAPPEVIRFALGDLSRRMLTALVRESGNDHPDGTVSREAWRAFAETLDAGAEATFEIPPEAFLGEGLYWEYVMTVRRNVRENKLFWDGPELALSVTEPRLLVERDLVFRDLNQEEIASANEWRVQYLRRLAAEAGMAPYIQAYMDAWDLRPEDVFPDPD